MQNYMRTILSGLQNWINKRFRDEVAVADQNENNPDSPAYIKNRTHYEEWGVVEIMPQTAPDALENEDGMYMAMYLNPVEGIEIGVEHTITYNGTEYKCNAVDGNSINAEGIIFGNYGLMLGGTNTGEPFIIMALPPEMAADIGIGMIVYLLDGATELTLGIKKEGFTVHKLDDKYINFKQPDMLAFEKEPGYIKNRTHWIEQYEPMELDYTMLDGVDSFNQAGQIFYKVSDIVLPRNVAEYAYIGNYSDGGNFTGASVSVGAGENVGYYNMFNSYGEVFVIDNIEEAQLTGGWIIPSKGTYMRSRDDTTNVMLSIHDVYYKLDNKFLDLSNYYTKAETDNKIAKSINIPTPTTADAGKILRVNSEGKYELVSDEPKQYVSLADATTGDVYRITINNGTLVSTLVEEVGADE